MDIQIYRSDWQMATAGDLERELEEANRRYHESGDSPLTDDEYDAKLQLLAELRPASPLLAAVGHAVRPADATDLPRRMGSLQKKRTDDDLRKALASSSSPRASSFVLSDKLDGQSALLHAPPDGGALRMYSRGDGLRGRDLTRFVRKIDGIPADAAETMRRRGIEFVRGELVAPRSARRGLEGSLLRNFVTGLINSKNPPPSKLADIRFVAYEACGPGGACRPPSRQLAVAAEIFDHVVHHAPAGRVDIAAGSLSRRLLARKAASEYGIDGIVVAIDEEYRHDDSVAYPSSAFAFKSPLAERGARTRVAGIEWRLTRHGRLAPTLLLDEVSLNGSRVSRASGKSAKHVADNGLGVGAEVELVMAGDIIPDVRRVTERSDDIPLPSGVRYEWDAKGVHYVSAQKSPAADLAHLFETLPVKGFGRSAADRLVAAGVRDAFDILGASPADLDGALRGNGRGAALRDALRAGLTRAGRAAVAVALGCFPQGVGEKTIDLALASGHTSASGLESVHGIGPGTAPRVERGLKRFLAAERRLAGLGASPRPGAAEKTGARARQDKARVLAVAFTGVRHPDLERAIEEAGGRVVTTVGASTDYLVTKDGLPSTTGKGKKAGDLGVPVVTADAVWAALRP